LKSRPDDRGQRIIGGGTRACYPAEPEFGRGGFG
jgi:hypothetical protein